MNRQKVTNWGLFIILSFVWGSSFILMKKSTEQLTGVQIGSLRILSAGLAFLPFAIFHLAKIPFRKLHLVVLSGLLGNLFPAFLFAIAIEREVNSSLAAILNSLTPLFVVLIGALFFKIRIPGKKMTGVLIGFAGLFLLTVSKGRIAVNDLLSTFLILVATFCYGLNVNMVGRHLKDVDAVKIATVSMAFIAIPAAIVVSQQHLLSRWQYDSEARDAILLTIVLGVGGSALATALFYILIQKAGGLFASLVTYAIPVVAIFWGILASEEITLMQVGCLILILGGVWMANRK